MPPPIYSLTFDHLTLKLVCESHLRLGTFIRNLGTLGLWILELFSMYATNGRTDKNNAYCPLSYGWGHNNTVTGTLTVDGTARRGLGGLQPRPVPSSLYRMLVTAHPSLASVPALYYSMWQYNCLCAVKD